jgi:hypothetical protein
LIEFLWWSCSFTSKFLPLMLCTIGSLFLLCRIIVFIFFRMIFLEVFTQSHTANNIMIIYNQCRGGRYVQHSVIGNAQRRIGPWCFLWILIFGGFSNSRVLKAVSITFSNVFEIGSSSLIDITWIFYRKNILARAVVWGSRYLPTFVQIPNLWLTAYRARMIHAGLDDFVQWVLNFPPHQFPSFRQPSRLNVVTSLT